MTKPATRRSFRSLLTTLTVAGVVAASTFGVEREAQANLATDVVKSVAMHFVKNAVFCALQDGFTKNYGKCLIGLESAASETLTASDLSNISAAIASELSDFQGDNISSNTSTILLMVQNYERGTTSSGRTASLNDVNTIIDWVELAMANASSSSMGLKAAYSYHLLAPLRVGFYKERYEIMRAQASAGEETYNADELKNRLQQAQSVALEARDQLKTWSDEIDEDFGSVSRDYSKEDISWSSLTGTCAGGTWEHTVKYCYTGPEGKVCSGSETWRTYNQFWCNGKTNESEDTSKSIKLEAAGKMLWRTDRMAYREKYLGVGIFETIKALDKAASSFDFEYCGNGVCAIGEIDSCSDDCGSGSSAKWVEQSPGYTASASSDLMGAAGTTDATLKLTVSGSFGLSLQDNWLGRTRWSADSSVAVALLSSDHALTFGTDGNLKYTALSGNDTVAVWHTGTTAASDLDTTNKATRMVLLGKTMYMLNSKGVSIWNSDNDPLRVASTNQFFCKARPSSDETILSANPNISFNAANTSLTHTLVWTANGDLVVRQGTTQRWSAGTSGKGTYLCHQEDGNVVVYSETGTVEWYSNTGSSGIGAGGRLMLVDDQVRVASSTGDVVWGANQCSWGTCGYDIQSKSVNYSLTRGSSDQTVLGSGKAKLVFTSTGDLRIVDRTTGDTLWSAGTLGSGNTVSFSGGILTVKNSAGTALWTATSSAGSSFSLADCNLFISNGSASPVYTTNTVCDYRNGTMSYGGTSFSTIDLLN